MEIRILRVLFENRIRGNELPALRAAISEKAGREHILFHNHLSDDKLRHSYPLIQYKRIFGNAALVCIDVGVDEVQAFFANSNWDVNLYGRQLSLNIENLKLEEYEPAFTFEERNYKLYNAILLKGESYEKYEQANSLAERAEVLERAVRNHILAFAQGLAFEWGETVEVNVQHFRETPPMRYKGRYYKCFDVEFSANVLLPNDVGLGSKTSVGFGTLVENKKKSRKHSRGGRGRAEKKEFSEN